MSAGINSDTIIRELVPREGFQNLSESYPAKRRLRLIELLSATGVHEIEVGAFVSSKRVPQMGGIEEIASGLTGIDSSSSETRPIFTALCLNDRGLERSKEFASLEHRAWLYTSCDEKFLKDNYRQTHDEVLGSLASRCKAFEEAEISFAGLMISTAFGTHADGPIHCDDFQRFLDRYAESLAQSGTHLPEVSLADTMGMAAPSQVVEFIKLVRSRFPKTDISLHLHDSRGLAVSCALAGYEHGVRIFESSLTGLGGCPFAPGAAGNVATEDLVYALQREGVKISFNYERARDAAKYLSELTGASLDGKCLRIAT